MEICNVCLNECVVGNPCDALFEEEMKNGKIRAWMRMCGQCISKAIGFHFKSRHPPPPPPQHFIDNIILPPPFGPGERINEHTIFF